MNRHFAIAIGQLGMVLAIHTVWSPEMAPAAIKNWNTLVANGSWNTGGNWSGGTVPATGDVVNIIFPTDVPHNVTYDFPGSASLGLLTINLEPDGGVPANAATLSMTSNLSLTAAAMVVGGYTGSVGTSGKGAVLQSAGTVTMSPGTDLALGHGSGSSGVYTLSGGALVASQSEFIGLNGTGTFNHTGGTNTITASAVGAFDIAAFAGSTGTYNLSGTGSLSVNKSAYIGDAGIGNFNQSGGTNTVSGDLILGYNAGATGTYTLSGGTLSAGGMIVGLSGDGTLILRDGATLSVGGGGQPLQIAFTGSSFAVVDIGNGSSAGTLQASAVAFGAPGGNLVFSQTDDITFATPISGPGDVHVESDGVTTISGTNTYTGQTVIGEFAVLAVSADANLGTPPATIQEWLFLSGGTLRATESFTLAANRELKVFVEGAISVDAGKTLTLNGFALGNGARLKKIGAGKLVLIGTIDIGTSSASGTFAVHQGEVSTGALNVGQGGTGAIVVDGGLLRTGATVVGTSSGSGSAEVSGAGSAWLLTDELRLGSGTSNSGTLTVANGGSVSVNAGADPIVLGSTFDVSANAINIGTGGLPGTLSASNIIDETILGTTAINSVNFNHVGSLPFAIPVSGRVAVNKLGAGTTTLSGAHTYTGPTTVQAGTLIVAGSLSFSPPTVSGGALLVSGSVSGATTVNSGGTLGGTGTTAGVTVNAVGSLAPGMSVGTLTTGNLTLSAGSFSRFELATPGVVGGGVNDLVAVTGDLLFSGTLVITQLPGFTAGSYPLFTYTSIAVNQGFAFESSFLAAHPGSTITIDNFNKRVLANITTALGLSGDYNQNGTVDAADYVVWRNSPEGGSSLPNDDTPGVGPDDYTRWRNNFGNTLGGSSAALQPVPEPVLAALTVVVAALAVGRPPRQNRPDARRVFLRGVC